MNKNLLSLKIWAVLGLFILASCQQDDDIVPGTGDKDSTTIAGNSREAVNDWISENMDLYYFWNTSLPATSDRSADPSDYFYDLLYSTDKFSYITDDARSLKEEYSGTSLAVGYSPAFVKFNGSDQVFIVVEYVYPNSSAAIQGLERGDIILSINSQKLNTSNYYSLYKQQKTYTVGLGKAENGSVTETETSYSISPAYINTDPVVHWEIKEIEGKKIGYIVYVEFLSGDNDTFLGSVDDVFSEMKAEGVTELIMDLRYNPGGEITAAKHLANAIAPQAVTSSKEVFVQFQYNEGLENFYREREGDDSDNIAVRFDENPYNLGLNRVIFLTTSGSASASELIINGLEPYMEVVSIGEPTYGKFYGSYVIYDRDREPAHNYAIMPIVMKYANAQGVTDFENGLQPDYFLEDNMLEAKPFGDVADPMMAQAIEVIIGPSAINARTDYKERTYTPLENTVKLKKGNVFRELSKQEFVN